MPAYLAHSNVANRILAALPMPEYERLLPHLETVSLIVKQVIYEQNAPIEYVYFPLDSVVSEVARMKNGQVTEVTTIGKEGMVGVPVFLETDQTDRTPLAAFAQVAGEAMRMKAQHRTPNWLEKHWRRFPAHPGNGRHRALGLPASGILLRSPG